jgi:hypothetical protein
LKVEFTIPGECVSKDRPRFYMIFLLLFLVSVFLLVPDIINGNKDIIIIINRIFIMLLMLFCSLGSLLTSINKDENKRAERDERNELVELKSGSMVSKILFYLFIFF